MSELEAGGGETTLLSPEPTTTSAWYGEENKELVEAKGWKSSDDALKSYSELEKMSSGRVKMPTPESSAEEIRAFYQKTGCPENADGYEITTSEETAKFRNEGIENELKGVAHEMGVSKQAFEAIVGRYYETLQMDMAKSYEQGETALKEEFGEKYKENMDIAQRFAQEACSPEFMEVMDASGLGNNPIILKEFMNLGKKTMSDTLIKGETGNSEDKGYVPSHINSPDQYANGDDEDSAKARAYFTAKGHKY